MATTKLHQIKNTESRAIAYVINGDKTEKGVFVHCYMCSKDPLRAAKEFQITREVFKSRTEVLDHHIIQAFKPGEVTPEQAHRIGMELCEKLFRGEYQFILSTHTDKDHIHNHVIVNNTNVMNGKSFNTLENKGTHFWRTLRSMSDEICKEHGLSVVNHAERNKGSEHFEWEMNCQGLSWKAKLKLAISDCIEASKDFEDFLKKCPDFGIIAEYNPNHKVDLKFKLAEHVEVQPNIKFTRAKTLGWYYEKPQIEKLIILVNHPELMKPKLKYKPVEVAPDAGYGLKRWADIQNMKDASKVINILTEYGVNDSIELENLALAKMKEMGVATAKLNTLNTKIQDLSQVIKLIQTRKKYLLIVNELKELSGRKRTKFENTHLDELTAYKNANSKLKEIFPDSQLPKLETLENEKTALTEERSKLNEVYKKVRADSDKLNYARQALEAYRNKVASEEKSRKATDEPEVRCDEHSSVVEGKDSVESVAEKEIFGFQFGINRDNVKKRIRSYQQEHKSDKAKEPQSKKKGFWLED